MHIWVSLVAQLAKNLPAVQETPVRFLGQEDSPGEGISYPLQYSGLENSMDYIVYGIAKSQIQLSDFHFHALEKEMATHSSVLAWRIPRPWDSPGNPLQCSCLENPKDWGAWWAAVYGVAQSQT